MALDKLFLTVFVLEILVKWYNDFFGFWTTSWNVFDFVIVAASILGPSEERDKGNNAGRDIEREGGGESKREREGTQ